MTLRRPSTLGPRRGLYSFLMVDAAIAKKTVPAVVDTGFIMVTKENIDSQAAKNVIY